MEPLILTLKMDDLSQERFDRLREDHFPKERNFIPAHLTLFHKLPGDREGEIGENLRDHCREQEPFSLTATGLVFMGRGVGYRLESPRLTAVRRELADGWWPWLGAQDRKGFRPHVTVQNKVQPEEARALHRRLEGAFAPFEVGAEGLLLWRYLGGPWEPVGAYGFRG
ncbi:2'-5' RNA ligase family protein [Rubrobacter tropicus]|uniref:2'-5' RNA ligase family protein n=1 Tax=Rubrobacter tropicus TaxID=2653851 RepID=A0A6G8QEU1_9ACTN|nr:2'-5' RNA ligase family protein [Rubrobacter tropicus]